MKTKHYSLPAESYLASRQSYVQRFTLIYSSFTLAFSAYFTPQGFNPKSAVPVNILLFLIGAPFWFRKSSISVVTLNVVSQVSNALASIWICSFLGPTSHINLVAIPQFILVLMMFGGQNRLLTYVLGAMCVFQLSLPLIPFVDTWYLHKRMKEENLIILRELLDLSILALTVYQFRVISDAWRDALNILSDDKVKLQSESEWRFRLLRILSHDIKEPMVSALQLLRKIRKNPNVNLEPKVINQLENSQIMIREIISNVETYAASNEDLPLPKEWVSPEDALAKLMPWLKSRLEDKSITMDTSGVRAEDRLWINPESFIYQIFLNLLSNAIKFSPPHSKITLTSDQKKGVVNWYIIDQGKGINAKALQQDGFTEPGTHGEPGSGLGIKIAVLIAKKQGIEITWKNIGASTSHATQGTEVLIQQKSPTQ